MGETREGDERKEFVSRKVEIKQALFDVPAQLWLWVLLLLQRF